MPLEKFEQINWTAELEVALFHSMHGHKPVGLNKHFHLLCIQHKLHQSTGRFLSAKEIWTHLRTLYDLDSLDDFERSPLPTEQKEFSIPQWCLPRDISPHLQLTTGDGEVSSQKLRPLSSSPSPASSPLHKQTTKRKRT